MIPLATLMLETAHAEPWLEWACASSLPSLPSMPASPVELPVVPRRESEHVLVTDVWFVDAAGNATPAPSAAPTVIAADRRAPTAAVVRALGAVRAPVYLALAPDERPAPPPDDPAVWSRLPITGLDEADLADACPSYRNSRGIVAGSCSEEARWMARLVADCPDRRADLLALFLQLQGVRATGIPVVLVEVPVREGAVPPTGGTWGDSWSAVVAAGLPPAPDPLGISIGGLAADVVVFRLHDLMPLSHPDVAYPAEARAKGLAGANCIATVLIDTNGVPVEVEVTECDAAFHAAVATTLRQWRWPPPRKDGRATFAEVAFLVRLDPDPP